MSLNKFYVLSLVITLLTGCQTTGWQAPHHHTRHGALLGGLSGAGIGAAIGNANDETAAGALIGGAVGALTGGAIGNGIDEVNASHQAMIEESVGRRMAGATTLADAVEMTRAGLSDSIIIQHIRSHGVVSSLNANDLIALKQQGVSDGVIAAMQSFDDTSYVAQANYEVPFSEPAVQLPATRVVVRERVYPRRPHPPAGYYHRVPYRRNCGPGFHWGFSYRH